MTEAETIEQIRQKKAMLEQYRAGNAGSSAVKDLEDEIKALEASLPKNEAVPKRPRRTAFLDECAG
jgi:hypothetical protein